MTRRRRWATAGIVLLAVAFGASERPAWADPAEVESLIAQGNDLRRQGRDAQAVPLFKKAYDIDQTPRTAGQLGLVELAAGYPVEAADHIALALESPQHAWVAGHRRSLEKVLARAQAAIGEVAVSGSPVGAAVSVNGRSVGALPLPATVRVPDGRVVVSVTAPGYAALERVVQVRGKETQKVAIVLEKTAGRAGNLEEEARAVDPASAGTATATVSPAKAPQAQLSRTVSSPAAPVTSGDPGSGDEPPAPTSALRVTAWATAVAAVGGLGAGIGLQFASNAKADEFGTQGCSVMNEVVQPSDNKQCQPLWNTRNTEKTWSLVGYIGGGTLAVTSALLFWLSSSPATNSNVQAHAAIGCAPTLVGGVSCRGEF